MPSGAATNTNGRESPRALVASDCCSAARNLVRSGLHCAPAFTSARTLMRHVSSSPSAPENRAAWPQLRSSAFLASRCLRRPIRLLRLPLHEKQIHERLGSPVSLQRGWTLAVCDSLENGKSLTATLPPCLPSVASD